MEFENREFLAVVEHWSAVRQWWCTGQLYGQSDIVCLGRRAGSIPKQFLRYAEAMRPFHTLPLIHIAKEPFALASNSISHYWYHYCEQITLRGSEWHQLYSNHSAMHSQAQAELLSPTDITLERSSRYWSLDSDHSKTSSR